MHVLNRQRHMKLFQTVIALALLPFISCSSKSPEETAVDPDAAIVFTVDGMTRTISADEREADVVNLDESPIRYLFRKRIVKGEKSQFEIDFVFSDKNNLADLPKTYDLNDNPTLQSIASLSFMDYERKVERSTHKRLIFNKGTITIHELSEDEIRFEFEGEAHELTKMENRSPVSGRIHVRY